VVRNTPDLGALFLSQGCRVRHFSQWFRFEFCPVLRMSNNRICKSESQKVSKTCNSLTLLACTMDNGERSDRSPHICTNTDTLDYLQHANLYKCSFKLRVLDCVLSCAWINFKTRVNPLSVYILYVLIPVRTAWCQMIMLLAKLFPTSRLDAAGFETGRQGFLVGLY